jgi:hypothetical protein
MPASGEFQEFIVLRVPASRDLNVHVDPLCNPHQSFEKPPDILLVDVSPESPSVENLIKFDDDGKGK